MIERGAVGTLFWNLGIKYILRICEQISPRRGVRDAGHDDHGDRNKYSKFFNEIIPILHICILRRSGMLFSFLKYVLKYQNIRYVQRRGGYHTG